MKEINPMRETESYFRKKITFLNLVLTYMIVMLHATPNLRFGVPFDSSMPIIYGLRNITEVAVPLFFFISGLLFYYNCSDQGIIFQKIRRRFSSLIVPYLFWNALFFAIYWFLSHWDVTASRMHMGEIPNGITDVMRGILDSRFTPLWFIRNLIIYTVLAPVIYLFINNKKLALIVLAATLVAGLSFKYSYTNPFVWLPIYLQGAILGRFFYSDKTKHDSSVWTPYCKNNGIRVLTTGMLCLGFVGLYIMILVRPETITIFRYATPIIVWVTTDLVLSHYLDTSFVVKTWMGYTFFIYCTHYFVLNIMQKFVVLNFAPTELLLTSLMIITPLITVSLLILLASRISGFKIYRILNGGRAL